jgi:WD40 repeat protein
LPDSQPSTLTSQLSSLPPLLLALATLFLPLSGHSQTVERQPVADAMHLLKARCFSCHNEKKAKGGLVMTSQEKLLKGSEDGEVVIPGEPEKSPLIASLAADADPHMPPKKQLSSEEIATLSGWIKAGAGWDAEALVEKARTVALAPLPGTYQPVLALSLSPDGSRLAAGCGKDLLLYEVGEKELTLVARASAHPDPIQTLAWSPDGARIVTGAFRRVVIWNAAELSAERVIRDGLSDRITAIRFTPDNQRLLLADGRIGEDGTVRIADPNTGTLQKAWTAHTDTIFDLAISPDGKLVATAGGDKLVKIWDVETQKETARIEAHSTQVLGVAFNPDATQIVTAGADQQLKLWDMKTRDQIALLGRHTAGLNAVAWSSTGPTLFAVTDAGGLLRYSDFKAHTGGQSSDTAKERKYEAADTTLYCVAPNAAADRVFAGTHDGRILGWNKDGKLAATMQVNAPMTTAAAK